MLDNSEHVRLSGLFEQLKLKLLDLTLRNRMLNYSFGVRSKRHLQIVDDTLEDVYRKLVGEEASLEIRPLVEPDDIPADEKTREFVSALEHAKVYDLEYLVALEALESQGRDDDAAVSKVEYALRERVREQLDLPPRPGRKDINRAEHARSNSIDPSLELAPGRAADANSGLKIQTLKYPDELEALMEKIAHDARLAEQEMGVSTLFLAFGFLEWYPAPHSDKKAYAPLLLLPVRIGVTSVRGKDNYSLSSPEGTVEINLSLQKLFEQQFKRELPSFAVTDEGLGSIAEYLIKIQTAIEGLDRWTVHRWLVLGHFAFGRFAMYADLNAENWAEHPASHNLVKSILSGVERGAQTSILPPVPSDYPIDDPKFERIAPILIHDADASQHSALIDVMQDRNLVVEGPPGTGKSQTITNIIANALAAGKRVLFLAEKQAALEVVKRRLDSADLGDFCLELHSQKTSAKLAIESLRQRVDLGLGNPVRPSTSADTAWHQNREVISSYLKDLHAQETDGATPFGQMWKAIRGRSLLARVERDLDKIQLPVALFDDPLKIGELRDQVELYARIAEQFAHDFGDPSASPWAAIPTGNVASYDVPRLTQALEDLSSAAKGLLGYLERAAPFGIATVGGISDIAALDEAIAEPPDNDVIARLAPLDLAAMERGLALFRELLEIEAKLNAHPEICKQPPNRLARACGLLSHPIGRELRAHPAAELYSIVQTRLDRATEALDILGQFNPLIRQLGFDQSFPAHGLEAVALVAVVAAKIPAEHRRWLGALPSLNESDLAPLHEQWSELVAAESGWRKRLPKWDASSWPSVEHIAAAGAYFSKGSLAQKLGAMTAAGKAAKELASRLGVQASEASDMFESLAAHIQALDAFSANTAAANLLKPYWRGLETPFDALRAAVRLRRLILNAVQPLPAGVPVFSRLLVLGETGLAALAADAACAQHHLSLRATVRGMFDQRSVGDHANLFATERASVQSLRALDPDQQLARLEAPIELIAGISLLLVAKVQLVAQIDCLPLKHAVVPFGSSHADIDQALSAIAWLRGLASTKCPPGLKSRLSSADATKARAEVRATAREGIAIRERYRALIARLSDEFAIDGLDRLNPDDVAGRLDPLVAHKVELGDFLSIRAQRLTLIEAGLQEFLERIDNVGLDPASLVDIFDQVVAEARADGMRRKSKSLALNGATLQARRTAFAERDRKRVAADRETLRNRLLGAAPLVGNSYGPRAGWTEMSLLRNEFFKQRRFLPLRRLLARAGLSIQKLKPCFMMSPLSLAKFADPRALEFDLLVIDEASQMKPEDALGGMLRAKQIVVVGDPKQLPPTDFFSRSEEIRSDDDYEDVDDESILEACQKAFHQVRRLRWHYRSRCESLIAFSNREFYADTLITFPTAKPASFSVDLVRVEGVYQARRNAIEAARIAEEAVEFMRHFANAGLAGTQVPSLGIVAVNTDQRDLIFEELHRLSADDDLVQRFREKVAERGEDIFVKNLENVQGDERDYIFISLTYAREPGATTLKQRFGPINGKQGHRRLNVLFTRARVRVGLFASFGSADVRPAEGSHAGVHVLKRYLEYAETHGRSPVEGSGGEPDSDFEVEVSRRLREKSFDVVSQVGVSGFKIDLGVKHPDHPEMFLAGIECDGAAYHSSKSARDRDRLREEVLNGLGWELVRIWSTDWFDNPALETDKIVRKLEDLRRRPIRAFQDYPLVRTLFEENDRIPLNL